MSVGWDRLPLVPLRCVLEHLSLSDALTAMSVCRHWRNAILVYESHRELLRLQAHQTEKNLFLARLFRRHVRKLHIYIDCIGEDLDRLFNIVLPEFFDSVKLTEILFIGPSYFDQKCSISAAKLKRVVTESMALRNPRLIKFGLFGCEIDLANDLDRYVNEQIEYYAAPLSFRDLPSEADRLLSASNINLMLFSNLQHILVDYETISTESLETLSHLPLLSHLSLTITNRRHVMSRSLDWDRLAPHYPNGLDVSINIIGLPTKGFHDVIKTVLVRGLALVSLKVFFCKILYMPLLTHVVRNHKETLRELVWADCPYDTFDAHNRILRNIHDTIDVTNVNPLILLCWQCVNLRRLVIHGYWIWHYDVLGFARLRKTLQQLEISAIYSKQGRFQVSPDSPDSAVRVLASDSPQPLHPNYIQQVNEFTEFKWAPRSWLNLHPGLQARSTPAERTDYIIKEIRHPVGIIKDGL